jgi:penicillin-insensitive murein endopeptidase
MLCQAKFRSWLLLACFGALIILIARVGHGSAWSIPNSNHASSQAIGFYTNGSIQGAYALSEEGPGHRKLFLNRQRQWGTKDLVELIEKSSTAVQRSYPMGEKLQVGDLSVREGGDISRHSSHENGLDADFIYYRTDHKEQDIEYEDGFRFNFVRNGEVSEVFDSERNWMLLKEMAKSERINRIFVAPEIKKLFCERIHVWERPETEIRILLSSLERKTLRRLRPWYNHGDHMHVRLICPENSPECVEQDPPPQGTGCDALSFQKDLLENQWVD